jgi:phosphocarrier protein HPr
MRIEAQILNELGLHARPAAEFVRCVHGCKSTVTLHKEGTAYSAASILEVLMANLDCGARVEIEAVGEDEQETLDRLCRLLVEFRDQETKEKK